MRYFIFAKEQKHMSPRWNKRNMNHMFYPVLEMHSTKKQLTIPANLNTHTHTQLSRTPIEGPRSGLLNGLLLCMASVVQQTNLVFLLSQWPSIFADNVCLLGRQFGMLMHDPWWRAAWHLACISSTIQNIMNKARTWADTCVGANTEVGHACLSKRI